MFRADSQGCVEARVVDGSLPSRHAPIRTCLGCRARDLQHNLLRVVADGAGRLKIDIPRRQGGRGAYVHETRRCLDVLRQGNGAVAARSFRRKVILPIETSRHLDGICPPAEASPGVVVDKES